jgi:hypothetical protein
MRIASQQGQTVKLSSNGNTLVSHVKKGDDLEIEVWNTRSGECVKQFTITGVNPGAPIFVSDNCHWLLLGTAEPNISRAPRVRSCSVAEQEIYHGQGPRPVWWEELSLRVVDLERGVEIKETKGFPTLSLNVTVRDDVVILGFSTSRQEQDAVYYSVDLSSSDKTLKICRPPNHYGLVTPINFDHWIETDAAHIRVTYGPIVRQATTKLRRVDLALGQLKTYPYFPLFDAQQASPLGESQMIVNHTHIPEIPDWLSPWLTKYDLRKYWPSKSCQRIVICDAETGKTAWERRFPVEGYLQADISGDRSKLFVLYWKNDQLELYAYSLDFSWRRLWQQACATVAIFLIVLFFRWPRRKKGDSVPA